MSIPFTPMAELSLSSKSQSKEILNQGKVSSKQDSSSEQTQAVLTFQKLLKGKVQEEGQKPDQDTEVGNSVYLQFLTMLFQLDSGQLKNLSDKISQLTKIQVKESDKNGQTELFSLLKDVLNNKNGSNNFLDFFAEQGDSINFDQKNKGFDQEYIKDLKEIISRSNKLLQESGLTEKELKSLIQSMQNLSSKVSQESQDNISEENKSIKNQNNKMVSHLQTVLQKASEEASIDQEKGKQLIEYLRSFYPNKGQENISEVSEENKSMKNQSNKLVSHLQSVLQKASEESSIDQEKGKQLIEYLRSFYSNKSQGNSIQKAGLDNDLTDQKRTMKNQSNKLVSHLHTVLQKASKEASIDQEKGKQLIEYLRSFYQNKGQDNDIQKAGLDNDLADQNRTMNNQSNKLVSHLKTVLQKASEEASIDQEKGKQLIEYLKSFYSNKSQENSIQKADLGSDLIKPKLQNANYLFKQEELSLIENLQTKEYGKYGDSSKGTNWGSLYHNSRGMIFGNRWTSSFNGSQSLKDSPATDKQVIHQVISKLQTGLKSGKSQISVNMHPPELGKVKLKLLSNNSSLQAQLQVQNLQIQDIMERNMPILREALNQQGLDFDSIQVGVESEQEEDSGRYTRDEDLKSRDWRSRLARGKELDELKEEVGINPDHLNDLNGISIRV